MKQTGRRKKIMDHGLLPSKIKDYRFESQGNFKIRRQPYALKRLASGEAIFHVPPTIITRPSSIPEVETTLRVPSTTSSSLTGSSKSVDNQIRRQATE